MAQAEYNVENQAGALVRQRLNQIFTAIQSANAGPAAPAGTRGGMLWVDTSTSPATLRIRNVSDNAWIALGTLGASFAVAGLTLATKTDAEAGTDNTKLMTPLRTVQAISAALPPGTVQMFATSAAPSGWLKANGAALDRTTYAALFAAIGTTFGAGDGSSTFNLPDARGEFFRGWDDGRGVDSGRALGSEQSFATMRLDEFQVRRGSGSAFSVSRTLSESGAFTAWADLQYENGTGAVRSGIRMRLTGDETRPRNLAFLACIKF
jgi:hypothetical protein